MSISIDRHIVSYAAEEEQEQYNTFPKMEKAINKVKKEMEKAARDLDFMEAARLRDQMFQLKKQLEEMKKWGLKNKSSWDDYTMLSSK